ncbi:dystroglycan [Oratosquilla oratoria]|uniref:dystroglycan n=1 Tax=Oratosquilla oratoria TaxID=337810 RepID=UPI003F75DDE0
MVMAEVSSLPSWMNFDRYRRVLEGVPLSVDRGHNYVTITAMNKHGDSAKDVVAIDVTLLHGAEKVLNLGCRPGKDVTMLTVQLDVNVSSLDTKARVRILRAFASFLKLETVAKAALMPQPADYDPLSDSIIAGPGSAQGQKAMRTSLLQLPVGCEGEINRKQQAIVDQVEAAAKNGTLQEILSFPVLGWHVTQVSSTSRIRRQVDYSGYYDGEIENRDFGDYYDYFVEDYDEEPEERVIPSLATPVLLEPTATFVPGHNTFPHSEVPQYVSPVLRPVPISTPVYVAVKPTRVVDASPVVVYESVYPSVVPDQYPTLEPSITAPPTAEVSSTEYLPSSTTPPVRPTAVVEPTAVTGETSTVEYGPRNFSPRVRYRIDKQAWIAGLLYHLPIDRDLFYDLEDGDTTKLRLVFKTTDGSTVGVNSWIQFDPIKQEIYALPLEEHIGRYTFTLEAFDSEGQSAKDSIMIHVQQPREARNYNHQFTATLRLTKKYEYEFIYSLDWQRNLMEKIADIYGDGDVSSINVRSISRNPIKFSWTNTTLVNPRSTSCPKNLMAIKKVLIDNDSGDPSKEIRNAFEPEFHIKKIHMHYTGPCEGSQPVKPHIGGEEREHVETNIEESGGSSPVNIAPVIRNQIDSLNATQGVLFRFQVPEDTCYDAEDGNSRRLGMSLLTSHNLAPPSAQNWLQFDTSNQEFFGIPLKPDVGSKEYILVCIDSKGGKISDVLNVEVVPRPRRQRPSVEFGLTLSANYHQFMDDAHNKAKLIERIAHVFGDPSPQHIAVHSIKKGSVIITWHNSSLPSFPCPHDEIETLKSIMLDQSGQLKESFVEAFAPDFDLENGYITPQGKCLGEDTPTHHEDPGIPPEPKTVEEGGEDYLLTFIIPAIIIAVMLLLAAIIACCLYRRRRYGKMTMAENNTFVGKGIPIIFAEELDDKPDPAKSPVIMKDEKPPLPPPEYQRGSASPSASTPPSERRHYPNDGHHGDGGEEMPYQPPPPFTATNGGSRHTHPAMPPIYRKPPTYVPP